MSCIRKTLYCRTQENHAKFSHVNSLALPVTRQQEYGTFICGDFNARLGKVKTESEENNIHNIRLVLLIILRSYWREKRPHMILHFLPCIILCTIHMAVIYAYQWMLGKIGTQTT